MADADALGRLRPMSPMQALVDAAGVDGKVPSKNADGRVYLDGSGFAARIDAAGRLGR